jgi:hypothetical protein
MATARRCSVPAVIGALFALALAGPAAAAAPAGLVAGYGFEESAGAAVADGSAAGNDGTVSGAAWTASGRFGGALRFDGVDDSVSVPDADSLDLARGMTLEAWVKPSALGSVSRSVILKEQPGDVAYGLYAHTSAGKPVGQSSIGGYEEVFGASALPLDTWSHLAMTYDGATQRLYVGGVLAASRAVSGAMTASAGALKIGGNAIWGEWFDGVIDEVRVYDRALSAAEVRSDMDTAVNALPAPPAADTTAPTVGMTAPSQGATVSGASVAVAASATDDTAVAGVQFKLDGANLGSADTAAPYQVTWDASGASDGIHTLSAVATDAAGNAAGSATRLVIVANVRPTPTPSPTPTPLPDSAPDPAPPGLVAAYGFNEGSGSSTRDLSGGGNTGSVLGGATWASTGRFGGALAFDGSGGSVRVADSASLDLTTGMTLEAWVRPAALTGWSCVILKERPEASHLSYELSANTSSDRPSAFVWVGSAERGAFGGGKLPLATWSHLASTYDGATLRVYVNGALVSSIAVAGAITASRGDLRIYRQPLSAAAIQADMSRPL